MLKFLLISSLLVATKIGFLAIYLLSKPLQSTVSTNLLQDMHSGDEEVRVHFPECSGGSLAHL